jgi:hypothetical protein
MATAWQTFPIEFRGGLISNVSPLQQGINAVGSATILQNLEPSKEGGYRRINGFAKFSPNQVPGTGVILGVKVASPDEIIAVRNNGSVSAVYHSTGGAWSLKATAALSGGKCRFADYNFSGTHKIAIVDGVNMPAVFDDSVNTVTYMTAPTELEGSEHVAIFKGTVFYANGDKIYFSAPFNDTDFSAANGAGVISVSHTITGLIVFREQLLIFSRNKIQRLVGSTVADFAVQPITDSIGCLDPDTIQEVGGDIMYLAPDGLRLLSATDRIGDFGLEVASDPIAADAKSFTDISVSFSSLVLREKAQYRIFGYVGSEQAQTAKGLIATKFSSQGAGNVSWATTSGIKAYVADSKYTSSSEQAVFANEDGYVYELEVGSSFDGQPIESIYESPYMPVTDPRTRKTFYKLTTYVELEGAVTLTLGVKYDFDRERGFNVLQPTTDTITSTGTSVFFYGSPAAVYGTTPYGGILDSVYENNLVGSGKTISLRISDNSTNPSFSLDTAILEFAQNDRQ